MGKDSGDKYKHPFYHALVFDSLGPTTAEVVIRQNRETRQQEEWICLFRVIGNKPKKLLAIASIEFVKWMASLPKSWPELDNIQSKLVDSLKEPGA